MIKTRAAIERDMKKEAKMLNQKLKIHEKVKKQLIRELKEQQKVKRQQSKEKEKLKKQQIRQLKEQEKLEKRQRKEQEIIKKKQVKEIKEQEKIKKHLVKEEKLKKMQLKKQIQEQVGLFKMQQKLKKKHVKMYVKLMKELKVKQIPKNIANRPISNKLKIGPPPLKKLQLSQSVSNKTKYTLNMSSPNRQKAIDRKITLISEKDSIDIGKAAQKLKARFNVLRIFHKNKNPYFCKRLTSDMRYIDRIYLTKTAKTGDIC